MISSGLFQTANQEKSQKIGKQNSDYVEDFIKSLELVSEVILQLNKKAEFLQQMIKFEEYEPSQQQTCKPYEFRTELRFIVFQLLLEICEVIETFTTNDFFFPDN